MDTGPLRGLLNHLRRAVATGDESGTDAQLLERFATARDEAAFELLVWRHGPMVLAVCRRALRHVQDAEDAFQATFLTLARKAGSISNGEAVAGWLARVAYRVALRARAATERFPSAGLPEGPVAAPAGPASEQDVWPILDEAVARLPDKYRAPVVLCYLEGVSYEEAAQRLGWPSGTVATRLRRARELLRQRLARRGLSVTAGALAALLTQAAATAQVPAALGRVALAAARLGAAGGATARALALSEEVCRTMFTNKLRWGAAALVLTLVVLGAGTGALLRRAPAEGEASPPAAPRKSAALVRASSEVDGAMLVVGTEIKKDEKVDPALVVTVRVGGEDKKYRRLRVGDAVEEGQLLARLDDSLARKAVASRVAKLDDAEATRRTAGETKLEAVRRLVVLDKQRQVVPKSVSDDEYHAAKLTVARYEEEEVASAARVRQAEAGLAAARTMLARYEVRSPARGVIHAIRLAPGKAVKAGEPVVLVRKVSAAPPGAGTRRAEVPARCAGKLVVLGRLLRPGEKVAKEKVVAVETGFLAVEDGPRSSRRWKEGEGLVSGKLVVSRQTVRFRELEVGDKVEAGEVIGLVAPALALDELASKVARLDAAAADHRAASQTKKEAERRLAAVDRVRATVPRAVTDDEYAAARLTAARYRGEEAVKAGLVKEAQAEVRAAVRALELHELRSPVAGTVTAINRSRGEVVRSLEPVVQVQAEPPVRKR
jgi:RNA polymerase sigma factor (sigma-70 family)